MIGVLMLVVFLGFAALMYVRALPAILAVPLMAVALAALAGAGPAAIGDAIVAGSTKLAAVAVVVIFGAMLSRVTLSTGIAETIVTYAAEFGGDRPAALALALAAAVALLFTSLTGLGAIIMVGSIVLPIMMTVGVPRKLAATLFMLAFALGFIFNIAQWKFYTQTFGVTALEMRNYASVLGAIDLLALVVFALIGFRASRGYATWAVVIDDSAIAAKKRANVFAVLTPIVPLVLYFAFHLDPLLAFFAAALYGVLTTQPRQAVSTLIAAAVRGVEDVAPAILLFVGIGMLLAVTALPQTQAALKPLVAAIAPRNPVAYIVLFGVLSPLVLFRGPLNPFGVGIAVYTVLAGLGVLPPVVLVAAIMAVSQVQNACDPTNTQNVWVANFTGVRVDEIALQTLPYQVAVATAATLAVALFGVPLFGIAPFAPLGSPAAAAALPLDPNVTYTATPAPAGTPSPVPVATETPGPAPTTAAFGSGLFAPASAKNTIAVVAPGDELSNAAADAVDRAIARGWQGFATIRLAPERTGGICANKTYAAELVVSFDASRRVPAEAPGEAPLRDVDAGLELRDCSDYPVDQWYAAPRLPEPVTAADAERVALGLFDRVQVWTVDRPDLARSLFSRGLALDATNGKPTYLYSLFKTSDGYMRAYVRDGGPAYDAGLRTNDVINQVDGKFWWEYGTFQTQARAYDGKPHTFEITRGSHDYVVQLGAPLPVAARN